MPPATEAAVAADSSVAAEAAVAASGEAPEATDEVQKERAEEASTDGGDGSPDNAPDAGGPPTTNSRKLQTWAEKRRAWRQTHKHTRKRRVIPGEPRPAHVPPEARAPTQDEMSPEEKRQARAARKAREVANFEERCAQGATVVIDCEFEDHMNGKEQKGLAQQLAATYGCNRGYLRPVSVVVSGLHPGSAVLEILQKHSGFPDIWPGFRVEQRPYIEVFASEEDRARLVYLTADAEDVLDRIDPSKIYIIGGVIDRNRLKGITKKKADEQGIASARLPLDEHLDMGAFSRILTVNQVAEILVHQQGCEDWRETFGKCVPGRKVFINGNGADGEGGEAEAPAPRLTKRQRRERNKNGLEEAAVAPAESEGGGKEEDAASGAGGSASTAASQDTIPATTADAA